MKKEQPKIKQLKTILTIKEAAQNAGVENAYQLHTTTGMSSQRARKAWDNDGDLKLEAEDFDLLCDGLGCQITDLVRRVPVSEYVSESFRFLQIVLLTREISVADTVRHYLAGNRITTLNSFENLSEFLSKDEAVECIIVHIQDSQDWLLLELIKTVYSKIPKYIIFSVENDTPENKERAANYDISFTFPTKSIPVMASLIKSSEFPRQDTPIPIQKTLASIFDELKRLDREFFETSLRTLPQPKIGDDSEQRLRFVLFSLQSIMIAP